MFKVGDKVLCIDAGSNRGISKGEIYTFSGIAKNPAEISLEETFPFSYYSYRFVPASSLSKIFWNKEINERVPK